jgi:Rod binding domain-containing protein
MSMDLSMPNISPVIPTDLLSSAQGDSNPNHIKQVCKAMESLFTSQLMSELGKGVEGTDDKEGGLYQDFIQQAMTQSVTQGGGFGLAKVFENSLSHHNHLKADLPIKK